jgi:hypothetical protein
MNTKINIEIYDYSYKCKYFHIGIEHVKQLGKELWIAKQMYIENYLHTYINEYNVEMYEYIYKCIYLYLYKGIEHVKQLGEKLWIAKEMYMEKDLYIIKRKNELKLSRKKTTKFFSRNNRNNNNSDSTDENKVVFDTEKLKFETKVRYAFHRLSRSCWAVNLTNPIEESYNCGVSSCIGINEYYIHICIYT